MVKHKNKSISFLKVILMMISVALPTILNANTYYVATNGSNTAPYDTWEKAATSIQTAINAAVSGDIIIVGSSNGHGAGIYTENIIVNKKLTIQSENGLSATTLMAASSNSHAIEIMDDNVTIRGFSVYGATDLWIAGIYLENVNECTIENNQVGWDASHRNMRGIHFVSSNNCIVRNNIVCYNEGEGILMDSSNGNTISYNTVNNSSPDGIALRYSSNNVFEGNIVDENGFDGFLIAPSANSNIFKNNEASDNSNSGFHIVTSTDNILTGNTANNNAVNGFYIVDATNNVLDNDTANSNDGVGIGIESSTNNKVTSSSVTHNQYGIFMFGSSENTISETVMNNNDGRSDGDGIMLSECTNITISDNTMNNDPGDGIEFYKASNCNVIGNTVINSGWGIRINEESSNNVLSKNIVNDGVKGIILEEAHSLNNVLAYNITNNNSEDGIFLFDSTSNNILIGNMAKDNTNHGIHINSSSAGNSVYLNNLIGNKDNNVFLDDSSNMWHSPVALNYDYNSGTYYKEYLGNYYSDGIHTGSNGIGGIYFLDTADTDNYQLIDTCGNYYLKAWWLNEDDKMYINDAGKPGGSVTVSSYGAHIWKSDGIAVADINFPANGSWTGQLVFASAPANGHTFTLEIGSTLGGNDFTASGPVATIIGDGSSTNFSFETDTSSFTWQSGKYLALRIKSNDAEYAIRTGGGWSFITSPKDSIGYILPVKDNPEIALDYSLGQNYPNPFNPTTIIEYSVANTGNVVLKIYDILGREVETLVNEQKQAGNYRVEFNANNLSSGIYFYTMRAGNYVNTKKLIVLK